MEIYNQVIDYIANKSNYDRFARLLIENNLAIVGTEVFVPPNSMFEKQILLSSVLKNILLLHISNDLPREFKREIFISIDGIQIISNEKYNGIDIYYINGLLLTPELEENLNPNSSFNILDANAIANILKHLDPISVLRTCKTDRQLRKVCQNDAVFEILLKAHFPRFTNHEGSNKAHYEYLARILTKERFEDIKSKPGLVGDVDIWQSDALDMYDLLYNTDGDHDWGVISYSKFDEIQPTTLLEYHLFLSLVNEVFPEYKEDSIGRIRVLLNDIKNDKLHDEIISNWHLVEQEDNEQISAEKFIIGLNTIEDRLQNYIIQNTPENVRSSIKKYQRNIYDDLKEFFYNDDQIEFLQILHTAIRHKTLKIFDPMDFDFLMR